MTFLKLTKQNYFNNHEYSTRFKRGNRTPVTFAPPSTTFMPQFLNTNSTISLFNEDRTRIFQFRSFQKQRNDCKMERNNLIFYGN